MQDDKEKLIAGLPMEFADEQARTARAKGLITEEPEKEKDLDLEKDLKAISLTRNLWEERKAKRKKTQAGNLKTELDKLEAEVNEQTKGEYKGVKKLLEEVKRRLDKGKLKDREWPNIFRMIARIKGQELRAYAKDEVLELTPEGAKQTVQEAYQDERYQISVKRPRKREKSAYYLDQLKAQAEIARRTKNESLMKAVQVQVETHLLQQADRFMVEAESKKRELAVKKQKAEKISQSLERYKKILSLSKAVPIGFRKKKKELEKNTREFERQEKEIAREITGLEKEITRLEARAAPYLTPLEQHPKREEILDSHSSLFLREDEPEVKAKFSQTADGKMTVEIELIAAEEEEFRQVTGRRGPIEYEFSSIDEAYDVLKDFLNTAVRKHTDIRGVHDHIGRLIVEAIRRYEIAALNKSDIDSKEMERIHKIHADAVWEYDCIKRILEYWHLAVETERGMGVEFGKGVTYGRKMDGEHLKWLWNSYRGYGVKKAMSEKETALTPAKHQENLKKLADDGFGTLEDADVNKILGTMLRLGGGLGIYDGGERNRIPIRLKGMKGVVYLEYDANNPLLENAMAMTGKMSSFVYEVMKNTGDYLWKYFESRHKYLSFFLKPTGKYTEDGQPIYRFLLSNELFGFVTAYQMAGLEAFYFENIRGSEVGPDGKVKYNDQAGGALGIRAEEGKRSEKNLERLEELGWNKDKTDEENLRALAMFRESDLLAYAEGSGWQMMVDGKNIWDRSRTRQENLEALRALPIDQLIQLPGAYWLMQRNLVSLRAWEIDNWQDFNFDRYPNGGTYCGWAMFMNYHQQSRNKVIEILRGGPKIMEYIQELETQHLLQIPNHLAYKKEMFLNDLRDNISRAAILPSFWRRRGKGEGKTLSIDIRKQLAAGFLLAGTRKRLRLWACGYRGYDHGMPSAWPEKLLGRMMLQAVSEDNIREDGSREGPLRHFLSGFQIDYDDFVRWCGLKVKESHTTRSFDGEIFTWNEFEEMDEEELVRWQDRLEMIEPTIARMMNVLPASINWDAMEPAFEYKLSETIIAGYVEHKIKQDLNREGWRGFALKFFYTFGFPPYGFRKRVLKMRAIRKQVCGMDLREEWEKEEGEIVGRPWHSQILGLKKEKLPNGRVREKWCRPEESRNTPYIYGKAHWGVLVGPEIALLPQIKREGKTPIADIIKIRQIMNIRGRDRRRQYLARQAEINSGVAPTEETLRLLEQLADYLLTEDRSLKIKKRNAILNQEAKRKVGLDNILDLLHCSMEGAPLSINELSERYPWHSTAAYFQNVFGRKDGAMSYQYMHNMVEELNEKGDEHWTVRKYAEKYQETDKIWNPLTKYLVLAGCRDTGWIDRDEFPELCQYFDVDRDKAVLYYAKIKAYGFRDPFSQEERTKIQGDETGDAIIDLMDQILKTIDESGMLTKLIKSGDKSSTKRLFRNFSVPVAIEMVGAQLLFGSVGISPRVLATGLTALFSAVFARLSNAGDNAENLSRTFSRKFGMAGDRARISSPETIARGHSGTNIVAEIWTVFARWFGFNPIDLEIHPCTNDIKATVDDFALNRKELGGGQPT